MVELILGYVYEILLILITISAYTLLIGSVLPKCLLTLEYIPGGPTDRGLRKYTFPEGRGISYEPHPALRKYVSLYILFSSGGNKFFRLKPKRGVNFLVYELAVFNAQNKLIDVIRVSERTDEDERRQNVMLPPSTSYVSLVIYTVGTESVTKKPPYRFNKTKRRILFLTIFLLTAAVGTLLGSFVEREIAVFQKKFLFPLTIVDFSFYVLIFVFSLLIYLATVNRNRVKGGRRK